MGTIIARQRLDGSTSYTAQILRKRDGKIVHREAKTFDKRRAAEGWIRARESDLDRPGALEELKREDPPLANAIGRYVNESKKDFGRTKSQVLRALKESDLAAMRCSEIRPADIVAYARDLAATRDPSTVQTYMTFLAGVFELARPAWNYPLDAQAMADAWVVAKRQGFVGRSTERNRRPTLDELDKLMRHFEGRRQPAMPMQAITAFAIFSARRQGEIVRIRWDDLDEAHSRVLVRDMKDPKGAKGNHILCDLPPEALAIIKAQPRTAPEIFPYKEDTISFAWRDACKLLEIDDLRFHDLRHEAISRLFEMSWTIPHAAAVSGHRSWQNLKRYTQLQQRGDKFAAWPWLAKVSGDCQ